MSSQQSADAAGPPNHPPAGSDVDRLVVEGARLHRAGNIAEAEQHYLRALQLHPDHAEALHMLGALALQVQRHDVSVALLERAVRQNTSNPTYLYNFALALQQQGRLDDAVKALDVTLALKPDHAGAHKNRANLLLQLGRPIDALQSFDAELALRPDQADTWQHRANALQELRRFDEALASYDRVLALKPDHVGAWLNRGNICGRLGRRDEALSAFDRALDLHPGLAGAWLGRANIRCAMGRIDEALADYEKALAFDSRLAAAWVGQGNALSAGKRHREALVAYDKAIALDFGLADAWLGRGNACRELAKTDDALVAYETALGLAPDLAEAHLGRGNALTELDRYDEALARYDRAIELRPDLAAAWLGRGNVLRQKRSHHEALAAYDEALRLDPNLAAAEGVRLQAKMAVCNWDHFEADRARLIGLLRQGHILRPFDLLSISPEPEDQYRCASLFSESNWPQPGDKSVKRARQARQRIHLAYMSADFRQHPTAYLMADIIEHHDRSGFEVSAISIGPDDASPMRQRLRTSFDRFVEARSQTDEQIAKLIEEAGVDILVDLMGFTKGARGGVITRRPAPIQVNYLGYPGTMGMTEIDYIIADHVVIPHHTRAFFSEKVAYLPFTYNPNGRVRRTAAVPAREEVGLRDEAVVMCCFNNCYKILPDIFGAWMRILASVDGSVLWLLEDDEMTSHNLRSEAATRGVAPERLIFAPRVPHGGHLARLRCADLFLDTLPYNAHTTASDALWEDLPVVTLKGQAFAARVAASLLTALDLPELITETMADYERVATELARHPDRLTAIRQKLERHRLAASAFDPARFTRQLEAAYRMMYERHQAGLEPGDFDVPAVVS